MGTGRWAANHYLSYCLGIIWRFGGARVAVGEHALPAAEVGASGLSLSIEASAQKVGGANANDPPRVVVATAVADEYDERPRTGEDDGRGTIDSDLAARCIAIHIAGSISEEGRHRFVPMGASERVIRRWEPRRAP